MNPDEMTLAEALEILGIPEFHDRIVNSNSHGELFHCAEYVFSANKVRRENLDIAWFRPWFLGLVKWAEENWERPESVFQHLHKQLRGPPK